MKTIPLGNFKYTLLESPSDITSMPLMKNLFGINNRIYANLGSFSMSEEDKKNYSKFYTEEELKLNCLNRLFEVHIHYTLKKSGDNDYKRLDKIDFKDLFEFVKKNFKKIDRLYASYNDSDNKKDSDLGILLIPLNSKILHDACNYACQEIEKIKMDNMLIQFNPKDLQIFLNIF